jgi:hypothetical protein
MRIAEAQRRRWRAYAAEIGAALPSSALTRQALPAPVLAWHPADTCAVADDAGFPCPWLISSLCLFYQTRSK